jgi:glycosyltransferase involved in cell wall biosynthesis
MFAVCRPTSSIIRYLSSINLIAFMKPLRLLIVVPRFWPHIGDTELFAGHLVDELITLGAQPRVLSSQWAPEWPASMTLREVPVVRVRHAPRGGLNTLRYMIDLTRWLRRSHSSFDAVYVLGLRHEAYATQLALNHLPIPVVLRCQEAGANGDCAWQSVTRFGDRLRARCRMADAIIAPTSIVASELADCGFERHRIHVIPGGAKFTGERNADQRFRARSCLAEVNQDLATAEYSPLVVWVGRLMDAAAMLPLLKAWRDIAARWPSARLWLIGDGPARSALYAQLIDWELQYQVLMPGTFEDLGDVLLAADLYVAPEALAGSQMIIEAMAAGLPVLAADSPEVQSLVEHGRTGFIAPRNDHDAWLAALSFVCDNLLAVAKMGVAAEHEIRQKFSPTAMAQRHLDLFERLRRDKV